MTETSDIGPGGSERSPDADGTADPDEDLIDEASEESFPASDSPSSWAGPPSETR